MERYIGMDVHAGSCTLAVISEKGRKLKDFPVETHGQALVEALRMIPGHQHLVMEEGLQSAWLYETLNPHVDELVVAGITTSRGPKSDKRDKRPRWQRLRGRKQARARRSPDLTSADGASELQLKGVEDVLAANKTEGDPVDGLFTLDLALAGLEGEGTLFAEIVTPRGSITCELFEELTPITVANFVGLARGTRPFLDAETGQWGTRPYYDNTTFHRIIPGFMIQGGDPTGTRMGNPGFVIPDEIRPSLIHAEPGILSMANRGPNTGGGQFFVTLGPTPNLDGKHSVFGKCDPASIRIADDISIAPRDSSDKPLQDELVNTNRILRR